MTVSVKNLRGRSRDHENQKETTHGLVWWTRVASAPSRRERTPQHRPFGFYVKVFFGRAVLVKVVGDGVGLVVRVGDAADVAEARRPARAVAVPARMASKSKKKPPTSMCEGTVTLQNAEIIPIQMFRFL